MHHLNIELNSISSNDIMSILFSISQNLSIRGFLNQAKCQFLRYLNILIINQWNDSLYIEISIKIYEIWLFWRLLDKFKLQSTITLDDIIIFKL